MPPNTTYSGWGGQLHSPVIHNAVVNMIWILLLGRKPVTNQECGMKWFISSRITNFSGNRFLA